MTLWVGEGWKGNWFRYLRKVFKQGSSLRGYRLGIRLRGQPSIDLERSYPFIDYVDCFHWVWEKKERNAWYRSKCVVSIERTAARKEFAERSYRNIVPSALKLGIPSIKRGFLELGFPLRGEGRIDGCRLQCLRTAFEMSISLGEGWTFRG